MRRAENWILDSPLGLTNMITLAIFIHGVSNV